MTLTETITGTANYQGCADGGNNEIIPAERLPSHTKLSLNAHRPGRDKYHNSFQVFLI
jgi:hypothetical protein